MTFMEQAIRQIRGAGDKVPVALSKAMSVFIESLDNESRSLITGTNFRLDENVALVGGRGIPTTPFVMNPKLFNMTAPNSPKDIPPEALGMGTLKLIQFPLIEYRSRIITRLGYADRLKDPEQKGFFDGLVEYGCYLHLVQSIRFAINDVNAPQEIRNNRKIVLTAIADAFYQQPGYEPLAKLIEFSLSNNESFPARMELALTAASSPIYQDSAYLPTGLPQDDITERRFLAHKFTQKLINQVGGVRTSSNQELGKILRERLEATKDEEQVIKLIAELAALENLDINPFSKAKPTTYQDWIELVASKDRWQSFSMLSPTEQFELLVKADVLYEAHNHVLSNFDNLEPILELLRALPAGEYTSKIPQENFSIQDVNYIINLAMQLPDLLEETEFSHDSAQNMIFAIKFFEQFNKSKNPDIEDVRQMITEAISIRDRPEFEQTRVVISPDSRLRLDIKDLSLRFSKGELEPIDVLKILQLYLTSNEHVAGVENGEQAGYPLDLTSWLKYVIQKGHTHSFGAFAGKGEAEAESIHRIEKFAYLLQETLPLYALADNLRDWMPWVRHLDDPLAASMTLIAFESKLDVIEVILNSIKERAKIEGDIFYLVFNETEFAGLSEDRKQLAVQFRDLFIERSKSR